jgi:hypothetical protein
MSSRPVRTAAADGAFLVADTRVGRGAGILSAAIDGEVVALDIGKGACYGLDSIGARIWSLIEQPIALGAVWDALLDAYDIDVQTCRLDVADLLADLSAEGLISVQRAAPSSAP